MPLRGTSKDENRGRSPIEPGNVTGAVSPSFRHAVVVGGLTRAVRLLPLAGGMVGTVGLRAGPIRCRLGRHQPDHARAGTDPGLRVADPATPPPHDHQSERPASAMAQSNNTPSSETVAVPVDVTVEEGDRGAKGPTGRVGPA